MLLRLLTIACIALLAVGCGSSLPRTIRVAGRVTFDGQEPPAPGKVYFLPIEPAAGFPTRPAKGDYDKAGYFRATTFEPGDGLMPAKYLISIESWEAAPNMNGAPGKSFVPKKYQSPQTSGFTLDITPRTSPQDIKLDIVSK